MAILEINGDFSAEKSKSDERFGNVESAIGTIEAQIEVLNASWQDDKSAAYIEALSGYLAEIKNKLSSAKSSANEVFNELYKCLKVYQGE